jgi:hypothetical protein
MPLPPFLGLTGKHVTYAAGKAGRLGGDVHTHAPQEISRQPDERLDHLSKHPKRPSNDGPLARIKQLPASSVHVSAYLRRTSMPLTRRVAMGWWFWMNIPLALLFVGCWAGIPLWLTLTRWDAELKAKHAEVATRNPEFAANAALAPVIAQSTPVMSAVATADPAYAGTAGQPRR